MFLAAIAVSMLAHVNAHVAVVAAVAASAITTVDVIMASAATILRMNAMFAIKFDYERVRRIAIRNWI